jgi:hypothetical protein
MAFAHGAGLMLLPWVMAMPADVSAAAGHAGHAGHAMSMGAPTSLGMLAVGLHTLAYLGVMTSAALFVYTKLGLAFLRTAWFNLDWVWAGALVVTGLIVLVM